MKSTFHICHSSPDEVIYRSDEDYGHGFNCLARAVSRTDSLLLAESQMSHHLHEVAATDSIKELVRSERTSYSMYFNEKYCRKGTLGIPGFFSIELQGLQHKLAAIVYTIRNAVHHGVTSTPFQYPYTSANCYFKKELGKAFPIGYTLSPQDIKKSLPRGAVYDDGYRMNAAGVFLRESVIESDIVENLFASPAAFLYLTGRKSGEDWEREQISDGSRQPPITLADIEGSLTSVLSLEECQAFLAKCQKNEFGRFIPPRISDLEVCQRIDTYYVPGIGKSSVYLLDVRQKQEIVHHLYRDDKAMPNQIRRCLLFKPWDEVPEWFLRMVRR